MADERGNGFVLRRRKGGGDIVTCFGGSLHLSTASLKNKRLEETLKHKHNIITEQEIASKVKAIYKSRLSLLSQLRGFQREMNPTSLIKDSERPAMTRPNHVTRSTRSSCCGCLVDREDLAAVERSHVHRSHIKYRPSFQDSSSFRRQDRDLTVVHRTSPHEGEITLKSSVSPSGWDEFLHRVRLDKQNRDRKLRRTEA